MDFEEVTSDRIYRMDRIVWQHRAGKHPEYPVNPVLFFWRKTHTISVIRDRATLAG
jgi:hypothetical protein